MEELSIDKISEVLQSPDLMKGISAVLGQLGAEGEASESTAIVPEVRETGIEGVAEILSNSGILSSVVSFLSQNKAERIALLSALRPFLSDEKKVILDSVLQILKVASLLIATNILK